MSDPGKPSFSRRDFIKASATGLAVASTPLWAQACAGPATQQEEQVVTDVNALPPGYFQANFGVTPEMVQKLLSEAMSKGADWADVYFQHRLGVSVGLEDDIVNSASNQIDLGVGIRAVSGDQTGYAFTEDLSDARMLDAATTAASIAATTSDVPPIGLHPQQLQQFYDVGYDWGSVDIGEIVPLVQQVNAATRAADPLVQRVSLRFGSEQNRIMVADSSGRVAFDNQPMTRLYLTVVMEKDGESQSNSYNVAARDGLGFYTPKRLDRLVEKAIHRTRILFESTKPPGGEMPVVLAAGSSGILLHEAIGHGMEADFNRKGTSIFADLMNQSVANEIVTIVDSGVEAGHRGAINVDDEGNLPEATRLVEDGILRSYLHDRISAKHYGVDPTGNGRRQSFRHVALPRMRSTYMLPGPHTHDEVIASVKRGIYCVSFTNGQVEIGAGDYTFYVKNGYLIEDGKLTAPIKDVNIIGNGPDSLAKISMVANDFAIDEGGWTCGKSGQSVPVSLGLPTVKVDAITVGGKA